MTVNKNAENESKEKKATEAKFKALSERVALI